MGSRDRISVVRRDEVHSVRGHGIAPFIEHSPIMNWLGMFGTQGQSYFIGVIELSTGLVLILVHFVHSSLR